MTVEIEDWLFWENKAGTTNTPELPFLPSRSKRRMSLLSRVTLHLGHTLMESKHINDVIFASRFGEIRRQLSITNSILDDGEVSPAAFSYSVFNTPAALLSLTEGLTGITRAVYSGENSLVHGLLQSLLVLNNSEISRLLFIMADEPVPEYYRDLSIKSRRPLAMGMVLTTSGDSSKGISLSLQRPENNINTGRKHEETLLELQKWLLTTATDPLILNGEGFSLELKGSSTE